MLALSQVALVIFFLTGVTSYSGLREELEGVIAAFTEALNQQDLEKAASFYTEDCSVMVPGFDVAHGREGVKSVLKPFLDHGRIEITNVMEEAGPIDATDTAYDRSSWTVFDEKGNIVTKGKHIIIWKKVDGKWQNHIDNWNTDFAQTPQMDEDTLKAEIEVLHAAMFAAWKAQDFEAMASFYTEDARLMPPEQTTIQGKRNIREVFETICGHGVVEPKTEEVGYLGLSKDMAYDRGHYRCVQKDRKISDERKYVILWKKVERQWKKHVDVWSSNTPPEKPRDELLTRNDGNYFNSGLVKLT